MNAQEYIESGLLELYVYGLLDEAQNRDIAQLSRTEASVRTEIESIERAILNLSTSFSPHLSADQFDKIRQKLALKYAETPVIEIRKRSYFPKYVGWAAAVLLLAAIGVQYVRLDAAGKDVVNAQSQVAQLQDSLATSEIRIKQSESALAVIRSKYSSMVTLAGQAVSPNSFAKVYYNKATREVYVDAKGLPQPPEGKVYQVWALKLNPLTPTSIGLLADFTKDDQKIFAVDKATGAEGFGITLEPAGGSATPTMDQLYTLGTI